MNSFFIFIGSTSLPLEEVEVDFRLSILKPLHAQWLNMYNFILLKGEKLVISLQRLHGSEQGSLGF